MQDDMKTTGEEIRIGSDCCADSVRGKSEELGDEEYPLCFNKRTGRPMRKIASHLTQRDGFVNSLESISDDADTGEESQIEILEPAFDPKELAKKPRGQKKRKRLPSPSPTRLSPEPCLDLITPASSRSGSPFEHGFASELPAASAGTGAINLVAHIPIGFSGPLRIHIDLANLRSTSINKSQPTYSKPASTRETSLASEREMEIGRVGFLSLPAELRNQIYRLVLLSSEPIVLDQCRNLQHSSALLRTCKQVYTEGRTILYSENTFWFDRNKSARYQMWTSGQKEFGYRQLHSWLHLMSPDTRALIRDLRLDFDDALPSQTPGLKNNEERRYVHDGHLIESLKLLSKDGKLRKLSMAFAGRRHLQKADHRFMKYICHVKADKIEIRPRPGVHYFGQWHRISYDCEDRIRREMVRKEKIYPVPQDFSSSFGSLCSDF